MKKVIFCIAFVVIVVAFNSDAHIATPQQKEPAAYCIDPWTSNDMRERTYTPCARIPFRWKA